MRSRHPPDPAMTLANMRANGVRNVMIYYGNAPRCWHQGRMNLDAWPDHTTFDGIERRLVCTRCGLIGEADIRPNWSERAERESLTGVQQWRARH